MTADPKEYAETASLYPVNANREKTALPEISGLDIAQGLRNTGGDLSIFCNILADFCKEAEGHLAQINGTLAVRDRKLFITLVHGLKGAARSIGAAAIGEKASLLETKVAVSGDIAKISEKISDLQENVRVLINNIRAALERRQAEDVRERTGVSSLWLKTFKKALAETDMEVVNRMLLEYAGLSPDAKTKAVISEVEQYILMFEYGKAIEKLNGLL